MPAMGWPPTKVKPPSRATGSRGVQTTPFTPQQSITSPPLRNWSRWHVTYSTAAAGYRATITRSHSASRSGVSTPERTSSSKARVSTAPSAS